MEVTPEVQTALWTGMSTVQIVGAIAIGLILYLFFAFCLAMIAKRLGRPFGKSFVMAIIPIANVILILQMARKPWWWIFLLLIPILNIVLCVLIWMSIAKARGKPGWWGIIVALVPILGAIFFLILAFGKAKAASPTPAAA